MFEVGDVVERYKISGPITTQKNTSCPLGSIWIVEEVGQWCGQGWFNLKGLPKPIDWHPGWSSADFRLLKRRDPELMHRLLTEPAPEQEHERA